MDPEYYKNLKWMLENDITDVLDLTFTAESDFFGKTEVVELVPGGREIKVTEGNKRDYVNLIARHRMTTSIKAQIQVRSAQAGQWCGGGAVSGGVSRHTLACSAWRLRAKHDKSAIGGATGQIHLSPISAS